MDLILENIAKRGVQNAMVRKQRVKSLARLSGPSVAFLGKRNVADTLVVRVSFEIPTISDVVEVLDILINREDGVAARHSKAGTNIRNSSQRQPKTKTHWHVETVNRLHFALVNRHHHTWCTSIQLGAA